jgi:hypothetical protein
VTLYENFRHRYHGVIGFHLAQLIERSDAVVGGERINDMPESWVRAVL